MIPTDTIDKLEAIWRSTALLGDELDEREWKLATDLPGWTVQDNLAHLIGTERSLQGLPAAAAPRAVG
ncbi:MAG: maleylpyruvate isomerase N-terminal domain-containing protein, partial [Ilumatobacteraceae bacterium]